MSLRQNNMTVEPGLSVYPPLRRARPNARGPSIGPFMLLEQLGPMDLGAGHGIDFAPHPHIGLEAVTYLIEGEILHRDSLGRVQAIRPGEVGWMTAGSGITHSERTPPQARASGGNLTAIQAWVALPLGHEETPPAFSHYERSEVPRICAEGVEFTLIAGTSDGLVSPVRTVSELVYAEIVLTSGARWRIRPDHPERAIYVIAGEVEIVGRAGSFGEAALIPLDAGVEYILKAPAFHSTRLMLLGGEPLPEPRYRYWNFVSSSADRIEQAKADWREHRFADVPGEVGFIPLPDDPRDGPGR
jgi:redox-sensitive bicupin YhaK (pirin superfamily)